VEALFLFEFVEEGFDVVDGEVGETDAVEGEEGFGFEGDSTGDEVLFEANGLVVAGDDGGTVGAEDQWAVQHKISLTQFTTRRRDSGIIGGGGEGY